MSLARPQPSSGPVVEWRRDRLVEAGFGPDEATAVAEDCGIDLHAVLELVDRGCPPALATRIIAPSPTVLSVESTAACESGRPSWAR